MTFTFTFDINTHTFTFENNGAHTKLTFNGSTIVLSNADTSSYDEKATCSQPTTMQCNDSSSISSQPSSQPQQLPMGVTTYIHDVLSDQSTIPKIQYNHTDIFNIVDNITDKKKVFEFMNTLHKIDPRMNGIAMEGLLYLSINQHIHIDTSVVEYLNYNTIYDKDVFELNKLYDSFDEICHDLLNEYSMIGYADEEPKVVKYNDKVTETNMVTVLYTVAYIYINMRKLNTAETDYVNKIQQYGSLLVNNIDEFDLLFKYVSSIGAKIVNLKSTNKETNAKLSLYVDIPIKEYKTKQHKLCGNIDMIGYFENENGDNNNVNNVKEGVIFDVKCCGNDGRYINANWPSQLNLYELGIREKCKVKEMYIINVMTNHMIKYETERVLNESDLE